MGGVCQVAVTSAPTVLSFSMKNSVWRPMNPVHR